MTTSGESPRTNGNTQRAAPDGTAITHKSESVSFPRSHSGATSAGSRSPAGTGCSRGTRECSRLPQVPCPTARPRGRCARAGWRVRCPASRAEHGRLHGEDLTRTGGARGSGCRFSARPAAAIASPDAPEQSAIAKPPFFAAPGTELVPSRSIPVTQGSSKPQRGERRLAQGTAAGRQSQSRRRPL